MILKKSSIGNRLKKYILLWLCICLTVLINTACATGVSNKDNTQTKVETAEFIIDKKGVPIMNIEDVGEVRHPAWIGIYALQYGGCESFYDAVVEVDENKFANCIKWLIKNKKETKEGYTIWEYTFDSTYNDVSISAPWYSAFGQAVPIEALVEYYNKYGDEKALKTAIDAAEVLFINVSEGGLLFEEGEDIWFEEIPSKENPSHILNGHMRTLIAIQKLYQATEDEKYAEWFNKGMNTLKNWLPMYDTGYWLRYDLNPKKTELLFRFNNKYGYQLEDLAIDSISLTDPVSGESIHIDVGVETDSKEGEPRIAGTDWQMTEELDGRTIRRLSPVEPKNVTAQQDGELYQPYTFFYLNLPGEWANNLRTDWFELTIVYKDEEAGNLNVQMRSIAPGNAFVDLRDGDLLLTGSGDWREWKIPVRATDLGWWTGELYAEKHMQYLEWLSDYSDGLVEWYSMSKAYLNSLKLEDVDIVDINKSVIAEQIVPLNIYSLDKDNVLRYHLADKNAPMVSEKIQFPVYGGNPVYNPYVIAMQAMQGEDYLNFDLFDIRRIADTHDYWKKYDWIYPDTIGRVESEPAYVWLEKNATKLYDSLVWKFDFDNSYNDLVQKNGWVSAFSQKYVIDAFLAKGNYEIVKKAAYAYDYTTEEGGINSVSKYGDVWYEEVPNNSHILNAHLASLVTLINGNKKLSDNRIKELYEAGVESVIENLWRFDTGYWSKYDLNPKKDILLQFDWLAGETSPCIGDIKLYDPISNSATMISVGQDDMNEQKSHIVGTEWLEVTGVDGKLTRSFANGYEMHQENIQGGTRHNVYVNMVLPNQEFSDYFDMQNYKLIIEYKDVAQGKFGIKIQSINEGNELKFVELPNAIIECIGDNQWKKAIIDIRPQDLGWYMGEDYQVYHNQQLELLTEEANSWLLKQYLEKWNYYLDCYNNDTEVIIKLIDWKNVIIINDEVRISDCGKTYEGFGVENAFDGDAVDDYTAFLEAEENQSFVISWDEVCELSKVEFIFESNQNFVTDYNLTFYYQGNIVKSVDINNQTSQNQYFDAKGIVADSFRFTAIGYSGQERILLRLINVYAYEEKANSKESINCTVYAAKGIDKDKLQAFLDGETEEALEFNGAVSFTLGFGGEYSLDKILMNWEKTPDSIRICDTDYSGVENYKTVYESLSDFTMEQEIRLEDVNSAYIIVYINKDSEEDAICKLKDFRMEGKSNFPQYLQNDLDIVIEATDKDNPLSPWRIPIQKWVYELADNILQDNKNLTDHEKVVKFMESMKDYKIGVNDCLPLTVAKDRMGSCGSFANLLVALCATQDMRSRLITMGNFPENDGHTVVEVLINGKWSLYDPTYGVYFTTTPEEKSNPYVLSFEELREGRGMDNDVTRVIGFENRVTSDLAKEFISPAIYVESNPAGVFGVDKPMIYPLYMDIKKDNCISKEEFSAAYQGINYIGAAGINHFHNWTITGLEVGKEYTFYLTTSGIMGDKPKDIFALSTQISGGDILGSHEIFFENSREESLTQGISFVAKEETVHLLLSHDYRGPEYHYINIMSVKVEQMN